MNVDSTVQNGRHLFIQYSRSATYRCDSLLLNKNKVHLKNLINKTVHSIDQAHFDDIYKLQHVSAT